MEDVIEITSDSDSDVEIVGVTAPARDLKTESCGLCRSQRDCSEGSRYQGSQQPGCSFEENIDLTGDENEVHNQVNSTKDMGSVWVDSTNYYQAEQSPQIPVSNNLNHFMLDSDDDLMNGNGGHLSPGLQTDSIKGREEPDLKVLPLLTAEFTTEESSSLPISRKLSNEDPLPELDFIGVDETWDSHITETDGDFCRTLSQLSSSSICSVDSATDTSINSDVESLETFFPDVVVPYSSPSSNGGLLEDLKSISQESNLTADEFEASLSTDIEDVPPLIPQNTEDLKVNTYHFAANLNTPAIKSWQQLPSQDQKSESDLCSLPIESKAHGSALALDQCGDQNLSPNKSESHLLTSNETKEASPNCSVDKELLKKFHYFMGVPVQHLFVRHLRNEKWHKVNENSHSSTACLNKSKEPELISQRQCSMINSTIDENFFQGTLQFLMDFVSPHHYPPHKVVQYTIKKILLSNESSSTIMSAYMTLMKIQQLHPANISTVQWDWELLAYHLENKGQHKKDPLARSNQLLFLQYVVQTLEDDFQLKHDMPQKSIAKSVLSCDDKFSNVRCVIKWLIDTISKDSEEIQKENGPTSSASNNYPVADTRNPKVICLLQKMLTLAVEVDRSPTCSSNKIAEAIFQHFIYISERSQRLTLLTSMDSQLLRCKLLEFLFDHSTKKQNTLPMSLGKVLHFLKYAKFPLDTDDHHSSKWQYWDEFVHLLCLLLLSYQEVTKRHLRISITERLKYVLSAIPPVLTTHDVITEKEVLKDMEEFYNRVFSDVGRPLKPQLEEQISLLRGLLLCAANKT